MAGNYLVIDLLIERDTKSAAVDLLCGMIRCMGGYSICDM